MTATSTRAAAPTDVRPTGRADWAEANQQHLVAAIAEVRSALERHLRIEPTARATNGRSTASLDPPAALDRISEAFALSRFERAVLVLCAGVELDSGLAALCDGGPTFGLALAAFEDAHWSAITPDAPLRRWRLVELPTTGPLTRVTLRVDEHVLHLLAGVTGADPKLAGLATPVSTAGETTPGQSTAAHTLADLWRTPGSPIAVLSGADRTSRQAVAGHAARDLGLSLSLLDARVLPTDPGVREELARLLERESVLSAQAFLLECEADTVGACEALLSASAAPLAISAAEPVSFHRRESLVLDVPRPTSAEQRELWQALAGDEAPVDRLVAAFDLSCSSIRTAPRPPPATPQRSGLRAARSTDRT